MLELSQGPKMMKTLLVRNLLNALKKMRNSQFLCSSIAATFYAVYDIPSTQLTGIGFVLSKN